MAPKFFRSPAELQQWFAKNHKTAKELLVGYYKKGTGKASVTWPQSVDEALCVGWIDGIRKTLDAESYTIRFTPRRPGSIWSAVNIKRVAALTAEGRIKPDGLAAFEKRKENRSGIYSYEQRPTTLPDPYASTFRKNKKAWAAFEKLAPSKQKALTWWILSAKQEETRLKRLDGLIAQCMSGEVESLLSPPRTKR